MLVKVTENFYRIDNIFSNILLDKMLAIFAKDKENWISQPDGKSIVDRLQYRPDTSPKSFNEFLILKSDIYKELAPVVTLAESLVGKVYQNGPSFWYDQEGYINTIHNGDLSPNHHVNVQIYLSDGNENMGTYCYDKISADSSTRAWHTIPYRFNCGYMLLHPTKIPHGMKHRVVGSRMSLYQGFRSTELEVNEW